jgi:lipoprotein-anchoring transpeptidase ErfK/SrfK
MPVFVLMFGCATLSASASPFLSDAMPRDPVLVMVGTLKERFPDHSHTAVAVVSLSNQKLYWYRQGRLVKTYPVSTSRYGAGNKDGSYRTPLGVHRIREKIGGDALLGTIFKGRKNTHQVAQILTDGIKTSHDYITSRILWLDGLEPGINRGEGIDTYSRYIYIHGTHEEGLVGQPVSYGCVRMTNRDVIELYDQMREDDLVVIVE